MEEHTGLFTRPPTRSSSGSKQQTILRSASNADADADADADANSTDADANANGIDADAE